MQLMFTIGKAPDFDLTSIELFLAKDTEALITEGIPASELVLDTQNRQSTFRCELSVHVERKKPAQFAEGHNRDAG